MKRWYPDVYASDANGDHDLVKAMDAADAYIEEYERARADTVVKGRIEVMSSNLPSLADYRFGQLQDIEAIVTHLEGREKKAWVDKTRYYLEHYQRTLNERTAKDYAEVSDEVQLIRSVRERVAYVRNLYLGIMKAFEYMHYQLSNVTKLRCAGLEDAEIGVNGYRY